MIMCDKCNVLNININEKMEWCKICGKLFPKQESRESYLRRCCSPIKEALREDNKQEKEIIAVSKFHNLPIPI